MNEKSIKDRLLFGALLGLVGIAFGGSIYAWVNASGCKACGGAQELLLVGNSLAPLGTLFYGALLACGIFLGRARLFYSGVLLAGAVHLVLLFALYQHGIACAPCIVVGGAALFAATLSLVAEADNLARGSVLLPLGALFTQGLLFATTPMPSSEGPQAMAALAKAAPGGEPQDLSSVAVARLLVYTRPGCRYCDELEDSVLPELRREFGEGLEVSRERAPASLPTPTLVISGASPLHGSPLYGSRTVFPGLPPLEDLREAILRALGRTQPRKVEHESSMLPESR